MDPRQNPFRNPYAWMYEDLVQPSFNQEHPARTYGECWNQSSAAFFQECGDGDYSFLAPQRIETSSQSLEETLRSSMELQDRMIREQQDSINALNQRLAELQASMHAPENSIWSCAFKPYESDSETQIEDSGMIRTEFSEEGPPMDDAPCAPIVDGRASEDNDYYIPEASDASHETSISGSLSQYGLHDNALEVGLRSYYRAVGLQEDEVLDVEGTDAEISAEEDLSASDDNIEVFSESDAELPDFYEDEMEVAEEEKEEFIYWDELIYMPPSRIIDFKVWQAMRPRHLKRRKVIIANFYCFL